MLLLKLPKFGVDVEGTAKVGLPLLVSILREISIVGGNVNHRQSCYMHNFLIRSQDRTLGIDNKSERGSNFLLHQFSLILFISLCKSVVGNAFYRSPC